MSARERLGRLRPRGRALRRLAARRTARLRTPVARQRGLTPVSRQYGFDRGLPVDRWYIEDFLRRHGTFDSYAPGDIRGDVLEVGGSAYARRFGTAVDTLQVLHATDANPEATLVGDLQTGTGLPEEAFDCIICTQTLHVVYDMRAAVTTLHRMLRPGGVLLLTVPGITARAKPDADHWGDFWRLTSLGARRLLEEAFPQEGVRLSSYGNVRAASAFLYGLAAEELTPAELELHDPDYEVVVAARARKAG